MEQKQEKPEENGLDGRMEEREGKDSWFNRITNVNVLAPWSKRMKKLSSKEKKLSWGIAGLLALPLLYATALGVKRGMEEAYEEFSVPYIWVYEQSRLNSNSQIINYGDQHSQQVWDLFINKRSFSLDSPLIFKFVFDPKHVNLAESAKVSINGKEFVEFDFRSGTRYLQGEDELQKDYSKIKERVHRLTDTISKDNPFKCGEITPLFNFPMPDTKNFKLYHIGNNKLSVSYIDETGLKKNLEYIFNLSN